MSTDHEDLDPMSEQEIAALAVLDRRGRAAGAALMTAVAPTAPDTGDGQADAAPSDFDLLRRPDRRAARAAESGSGRRAWLLVAAVLVLVAAVAGAALVLGPRDPAPSTSNGRPSYLVPRWLPEGYVPNLAATDDTIERTMGTRPVGGQVVVYGLGSAPDPWAGATFSVVRLDVPWEQPEGEAGEPVMVAGHPGVAETTGHVETVAWGAGDATYYVVGEGVSQTQVLAAAESTGPEPSLDPATLPPGFEVIARAPTSAVLGFNSTTNMLAPDSLMLVYAPPDAIDQSALVGVFERPGEAQDVDLARLWAGEYRVTEVRGQRAVVGTHQTPGFPGERFVQWFEPSSGLLVTVVGRGLSEDDLLRAVDGLAPEEHGEIQGLLHDYGVEHRLAAGEGEVPSAGGDGPISGESIVSTDVASGDRSGTSWTLTAVSSDSGSAGLELHIGDEVTYLTWDAAEGPGRFTPDAPVAYGQPERALFAASDEPLSRATVESDSFAPMDLTMYPVSIDGHDFTAFVGFVPVEDAATFTVVLYDASGRELERHELSTAGNATSG